MWYLREVAGERCVNETFGMENHSLPSRHGCAEHPEQQQESTDQLIAPISEIWIC
jgi:hypothetical protein